MAINISSPDGGFIPSNTIITIDGILPLLGVGTVINNNLATGTFNIVKESGELDMAEAQLYTYSDILCYLIRPYQCGVSGKYYFEGTVEPYEEDALKVSLLNGEQYEFFKNGWTNLQIIKDNTIEVKFTFDGLKCKSNAVDLEAGQWVLFWQTIPPSLELMYANIDMQLNKMADPEDPDAPDVEAGIFKIFKVSEDLTSFLTDDYPAATLYVNCSFYLDEDLPETFNKPVLFTPYIAAHPTQGGYEIDEPGGIPNLDLNSEEVYISPNTGAEKQINKTLSFSLENTAYTYDRENIEEISADEFDESGTWLKIKFKKRIEISYGQGYRMNFTMKKNGATFLEKTFEGIYKEDPTAVGAWSLEFENTNEGNKKAVHFNIPNVYSSTGSGSYGNTEFGSWELKILLPGSNLEDGDYEITYNLIPYQNCSFANFLEYTTTSENAIKSYAGSTGEISNTPVSRTFSILGFISKGVEVQGNSYPAAYMRKSPIYIKFTGVKSQAQAQYLMEHAHIDLISFYITLINKTCLCKGTKITMSDYTTKNIEEVCVGDFVMSNNGPSRVYKKGEATVPGYHTLYYFEDGTVIDEGYDHNFFNVELGFSAPMKTWEIGNHALNLKNEEVALVGYENKYELVTCYGIWVEDGSYYANGLMCADKRKNLLWVEDFTLEQGAELMARLSPDEIIASMFVEE